MVSAISLGWLADSGKTLIIIQRSSQPVYSDKWWAPHELASQLISIVNVVLTTKHF